MVGQVDVANVALGIIGEPPISSFEDNLEAARAVNLRFPTVRDAVLRSHFWNFATKRTTLSELTPGPAFGFTAQFQLPPDWLRMLAVNPGNMSFNHFVSQGDYTIEGDRLLAQASGAADIIYIARIDDLNMWDALAVEVLASRLAAELAINITQNRGLVDQLWRQYQEKLAEARSADAMDIPPQTIESNEWTRSRFGFFPSFGHPRTQSGPSSQDGN